MTGNEAKKNNPYATIRKLSGLTQKEEAKELGCPRDLISKWETGERVPSSSAVFAIQALHFLVDNDLLEQFKDHRHSFNNSIDKGLTSDQIKLLISLSSKK